MNQRTPTEEIHSRWKRYRELINLYTPEAEGAFIFSRLNIFYFTGSFANGVFWLPVQGEPILFCRRGAERAERETPLNNIVPFGSYRDIEQAFHNLRGNLPTQVATEMNGLPWSLANSLIKYLPKVKFLPADKLIALTRSKKTGWELQLLREAGKRHNKCLTQLLPPFLHQGINELAISHRISDLFYSEGHNGVLRMDTFGEELFLGHIAVGDSANYPSFFNGPVGLRGVNSAVPFMGSEQIKWNSGSPLTIDNGFTFEGYQTDKTQVYWLGKQSSIPEHIQRAHNFCVEIQAMLVEQLKPGSIPSKLWEKCSRMVSNTPWEGGFMGLGNNKVNFVGHGIGLAIDEYPVVAQGFDLPLEEGMVLAIEPKVGLPGIGMVGTENTFEVTPNGGCALTGNDYEIICI
ncbi:MAG: aminopeptidase P family protein [Candidatus Electrothrix sp. ATG2]|nr:aminopeptidase P family protein [Candidatus Electrothrix sp. ATG2]